MCFLALIRFAFSQEKTNADTITPARTAIARSNITVSEETIIKTKASVNGILFSILKLDHAKVPITTINMTPTKAAIGICSIRELPNNIKHNREIAATMPESLPLPPAFTLIIDCPIMAQPPIPPKMPLRKFADP